MATKTTVKGTLVGEFWHNTGGKADVAVETSLLGLVYITLALRLWSRSIQRAQYQLNDWLIFIATILMSARYAIEVTIVLKCGLGLHISDVIAIGGPGIAVLLPKLIYIIDLLFVTIVTYVKLSILHFYSVIFRQRTFVYFIYGVIALCAGFWIAALLATALVCIPPQKLWYPEIPGHCGNNERLNFGVATTDFILDIVTFLAPFPILWKLQLSTVKKIGLSLVFGLGFSIVVITAVRFKYFFGVDPNDLTFTVWPQGIFSAVVPLLGIVNANLPVIQPALKRVFGPIKNLTALSKQSRSSETLARGHGPPCHNRW
ncbi:hypothetical protein F5B22DRAFT_634246 [Xylaria bambusicola]|uniref:uncharacterized protein n=1 Tax=Xylaria bambusicola TaxID=326684 RepID=UPI0020077C55|nr:uncharacterized protein F5B22DRAFT_634246 [Xylaria bambusicola]KAI0521824.1 hypothetical protein F5B22DRAFT_634246 [Xylaria bambusicola]